MIPSRVAGQGRPITAEAPLGRHCASTPGHPHSARPTTPQENPMLANQTDYLFSPDAPLEPEPAPTFDNTAAELGVEMWPLPEVSHRKFMADRDQAGWLEWQLTRSLSDATVPRRKPAAKASKRPVRRPVR